MVYVQLLIDNKKTKEKTITSLSLLENKPLLVYTISQFIKNEKVDKIIIPCLGDEREIVQKILRKHFKNNKQIEIIEGGNTRNETIIKTCYYLSNNYKLSDDDAIVVHDATRPFVTSDIINNIIEDAPNHDAIITAIKTTDIPFSLVTKEEKPEIVIHNNVFLVQTPKSFKIRKLLELYNELDRSKITRLWELFIIKNKTIKVIKGDPVNIDINNEKDLNMAVGIIKNESSTLYKKRTNKDFKNILSIILIMVSFLSLDIGIRYLTQNSISFYATKNLAPFLFSLSYILPITYFICRNQKKTSSRFFLIYSLFWILAFIQLAYFQIFNKFFIINDLTLIKEASKNFGYLFSFFTKTLITFLIITIPVIIFAYSFVRKNFVIITTKSKSKKYFTFLFVLLIAVIIRLGGIGYLGKQALETDGNYWNYPLNVYRTYTNSNKSLRVSGLYEYLFRDIYLNVNQKLKKDNTLLKKIDNYKSLEFKNKEQTLNEMSNLFEDKNLIMIVLESIDDWLVTEDIMPTLTSLKERGWNFKNYYAPAFGSSMTINAEFSALTGLHSPQRENISLTYLKNAFPYSLVNLFINKDYSANSIYYDSGILYNRSSLHQKLGFNKHHSLLDLEFSNSTMDDRELVDNKEIYKLIVPSQKQKFMTFITTYSAHGPYNETNLMCEKKTEGEQDLDCLIKLSKMTDSFLKELIIKLKTDEVLDKTVLVLYTNHYAYGYPNVKSVKKIYDNNLVQNVPFIIWTNEIEPREIETVISTIDITPTLANLFGLEYNMDNYLGIDVFSDNHENLVYFPDHTWFDGNLHYKGDNINNYDNKEYIKETSIKVNKKIEINEAILNSDYYRFLKKK